MKVFATSFSLDYCTSRYFIRVESFGGMAKFLTIGDVVFIQFHKVLFPLFSEEKVWFPCLLYITWFILVSRTFLNFFSDTCSWHDSFRKRFSHKRLNFLFEWMSIQYSMTSQQILSGPLLWSVLSSGVDWKEFINLSSSNFLTLLAPTSRGGQTYSNNSSDVTDEMFECVWPFCGV